MPNPVDRMPAEQLSKLEKDMARWRRTRKIPCLIPEEFWRQAVELARGLGIGRVARALGLNSTNLKRRVIVAPEPACLATFVELLPPTLSPSPSSPSCIGKCALEVDSANGSRLRVLLEDVSADGLALILRDFSKRD